MRANTGSLLCLPQRPSFARRAIDSNLENNS
jgi:hypothetical protein